jgi:hypothetical protein
MCCAAYCSFGVATLGLTKNTENNPALIISEDTHNRDAGTGAGAETCEESASPHAHTAPAIPSSTALERLSRLIDQYIWNHISLTGSGTFNEDAEAGAHLRVSYPVTKRSGVLRVFHHNPAKPKDKTLAGCGGKKLSLSGRAVASNSGNIAHAGLCVLCARCRRRHHSAHVHTSVLDRFM